MLSDQTLCYLCGAHLREGAVTYTQEIAGSIAVVTDVPVLTCIQCGEQYFTPETVDRLQASIAHGPANEQTPRTIEVPIYSFSAV